MCQQSLANALSARGIRPETEAAKAPPSPPASVEAALRTMSDAADVIFTGEVTGVKATGGEVDVDFRVGDGVRGVGSGTSYRLREWAGLWADGVRYRVGQHLLMLLHAASAAGFASPVGGMDGAIPLAGEDAGASVDLRWVATHVATQARGRTSAMAVAPVLPDEPEASVVAANDDVLARADRGVVMDLLHAWQRTGPSR